MEVLRVAPLSATGSVVPSPTIISPSARTAIAVIALVPDPRRIPPSVRLDAPVPPCATATSVPSHTPAEIVPKVVIRLPVTTLVPPMVIASASSVPSISASPETSSEPASSSPDNVIFLKVPMSLLLSTTTPRLAVTVPAVTASRTFSSAAVVVTAVPPIRSLSFTISTTAPPAVSNLSAEVSQSMYAPEVSPKNLVSYP